MHLGIHAKAAAQPLDSPLRVYNTLFACVEGMAFAAEFHSQSWASGARGEDVPTGTGDLSIIMELWVDIFFQWCFTT